MFNDNAYPRWINQNGQPIRELNQRQQEYLETPIYQMAFLLYRYSIEHNLPTAADQFNALNRTLNQLAEEILVENEAVMALGA